MAAAAAAAAGAAVASAAVAAGSAVEGAKGGVLSVASMQAKEVSTREVKVKAADERAGGGQDTAVGSAPIAGERREEAATVEAAPAANDAALEQVAEGAGSGGAGVATGLGAGAAETQRQQQEQEQADGSSSASGTGAGAGAGAGPHDVHARRGPPLLLQHGLLDSAAEFLVLGPDKALAFLLADAGELQHIRERGSCAAARTAKGDREGGVVAAEQGRGHGSPVKRHPSQAVWHAACCQHPCCLLACSS